MSLIRNKGSQAEGPKNSKAVDELSRSVKSLQDIPFLDGKMVKGFNLDSEKVLRLHHGLGRIPTGLMIVNTSRGAFTPAIKLRSSKYIEFSVASHWELMETKDIYSSTTSFDFETTLDSEVDDDYRITGYWKAPTTASANGLRLRVNGTYSPSLSNEGGIYWRVTSTGVISGATNGINVASKSTTAAEEVRIDFDMSVRSGEHKISHSRATSTHGTGTNDNALLGFGAKWEESTEIVQLGIQGSAASLILSGSRFHLYRMPTTAKAQIWVY